MEAVWKAESTHHFDKALVTFENGVTVLEIGPDSWRGSWKTDVRLLKGIAQILKNGMIFIEGSRAVWDSLDWRYASAEDEEIYKAKEISKRKYWFLFGREVKFLFGWCERKKPERYELNATNWRITWEK